jgi:hypothetical protein
VACRPPGEGAAVIGGSGACATLGRSSNTAVHRNRVSAQIQALKKMPIRRFEGWCHAASRTVVVKLALHDAGVLRKCGLFMPAGLNAVFRSVHTRMPIPRKHRRDSNRFFCISRSPPCQSALVMGGRQTIARPRVVNAVLFMPLLPPSRPESLRAQS